MQRLHFTVSIQAPVEKVWKAMLEDKTFREWTTAFMPGSHFVGSWDEGSKIQFLAADERGSLSGMTSQIKKNNLHKFVSIQHLGIVKDGQEDTTSEEAKKWVGLENYTFSETNGQTTVTVDVDVADEEGFDEYMSDAWPKALNDLKKIAETA